MNALGLGRGYVAAELGLTDIAAAQQYAGAPRKKKVVKKVKKAGKARGDHSGLSWAGFVDQAVQRVQQKLVAPNASEEFFGMVAPLLVAGKLDEVIEERSAHLLCGKVGCAERLKDFSLEEKTFRVAWEEQRIYDTTALKMFCSRECHRATQKARGALPKVTPESELALAPTSRTLRKLFPQLTDADLIDLNPALAPHLSAAPDTDRKNMLPVGVVIANTDITPQPKTSTVQAEPHVPTRPAAAAAAPYTFQSTKAFSTGVLAPPPREAPKAGGREKSQRRVTFETSPKHTPAPAPAPATAVEVKTNPAAPPSQAEAEPPAAAPAPARKRPTRGRRDVVALNQALPQAEATPAAPVAPHEVARMFRQMEEARRLVGRSAVTFKTRPDHETEADDEEGGEEEEEEPEEEEPESDWSDSDGDLAHAREEYCFDTLPTYCQAYEVLQDWVTPETRAQLRTQDIHVASQRASADVAGAAGVPNAGEIEGDENALGVNTGEENDLMQRRVLAVQQLEQATGDVCLVLSAVRFNHPRFVKWLNRVYQTLQPRRAVNILSRKACIAIGVLFAGQYDPAAFAQVLRESAGAMGMKWEQLEELQDLLDSEES